MKLYDAAKLVIGSLGAEAIEKDLFVNALNDFQGFSEVPAARHVIREMIAEDYCSKLYAIVVANENWQDKMPNYLAGFIQKHAYKEDLVVYVFMSIAYGLGWVDTVADYTDAQWNGQFVGDPAKEAKSSLYRSSKISLDIDMNPSVNFAMQQNFVPLINSLTIKNTSAEVYKNLAVEITSDPEFLQTWVGSIAELQPLQEVRLSSVPLLVSPSFLANLSDGISGHLRFQISTTQTTLFDFALPVNLDAYDYWCGLSMEPKVLASFVFPRHPALPPIINKASALLEKWTGNAAFDDYQTRDPNRAKLQMAAVYEALAESNVINSVSSVDYAKTGERVRFPDEVLSSKMATELDMALLFASLLEAIGLHVLIAFSEGSVMVGSWLIPDTFVDVTSDDVSLLSKRLAKGIEELAFINTKRLFANSYTSFDKAGADAASVLSNPDKFQMVLDVCRARMSHIWPLPMRFMGDQGYEIVVNEDEVEAERPVQVSADDLIWDADQTDVTKQTIWERRLLDLSLRNNLLSTRISKRTLQIVSFKLHEIEDALADGQEFTVLPRPDELTNLVEIAGLYQTPGDADPVSDLLKQEMRHGRLYSYLKEDELHQVLTRLYRQSRLSIEENGANTLFLAIGLMRWYETPTSTVPRFAPILLLPIEIVRKSITRGYVIRSRGEDTTVNITLLELLRQKFGINVSGLETLPTDSSGVDVVKVFNIIRKAIMEQPRWDVEELSIIGSFSFNKFLMWNDIHYNVDVLRQNKIVNGMVTGTINWGSDIQEESIDLDQTFSVGDLALLMPADSSQVEAISAALSEKSFVLHGPPGTGKSQTITNIIANALYRGKKVLFVAEKMAALQVVQRRLDSIGLAPFCLELHSNKAKKSSVIEQLRHTVEVTKKKTGQQFQKEAAQLNALRNELNGYVTALHKTYPAGRSLYDCFSDYCSVIEFGSVPALSFEAIDKLGEDEVHTIDAWVQDYMAICDIIGEVPKAPLLPCKNPDFHPGLRTQLQTLLTELNNNAGHCLKTSEALCSQWSLTLVDNPSWLTTLSEMLSFLLDGETLLPGVLSSKAYDADSEIARNLIAWGRMRDEAHEEISSQWDNSLLNIDVAQSTLDWEAVEAFMSGYDNGTAHTDGQNLAHCFLEVPKLHDKCIKAKDDIVALLGMPCGTKARESEHLETICKTILELKMVVPKLLAQAERSENEAELLGLVEHVEQRDICYNNLVKRFRPSVFDLDCNNLQKQWNEASVKSFISKWLGKRKVAKLLNLHAINAVGYSEVPDVLMQLCNYKKELEFVNQRATLGKEYLGKEWQEGRIDVKAVRQAIEHHAVIHRELLAMTQNKQNACSMEKTLIEHIGGDVSNFHVLNDTKLTCFVEAFNELVSSYREYVCYGVSSNRILDVVGNYQEMNRRISSNNEEGMRLFGVLWHPDEHQWEAMEEALIRTRNVHSHIIQLEQDLDKQKKTSEKIAESYSEGWTEKADNRGDLVKLRSLLPVLTSQGETIDNMLCGKMIVGDVEPYLEGFFQRTRFVLDHLDELKDICKYNQIVGSMPFEALRLLVDKVESGEVDSVLLGLYYKKCFARTYAEYILTCEPSLNGFHGQMFEEKINQYRKLCDRFERLTREELYAKLASNMPNFQIEASSNSEVGILQRNIRNGARGVSLRTLFDKIPDLLTRICPCMLMSPISVAQYINAKGAKFDYVIFDEASQMPTCEAVGAIARGKNVIVVGDPKQLPPTTFFEKNAFDEDNVDKEDLESILDDCLALSMPSKYLQWHYRSKHESLIAFSNMKYYDNRLLTFPSPDDLTSKVAFQYIPGVYDKGRTRQNKEEAVAVVEEIKRRLSDPELSKQSIGVVTFNTNQQSLIEDLLGDLFDQEPNLEQVAEASEEPIFVKNLENVQGDERDVILFSVGYGPDKTGKVSMNFGPLNREGGWRRLNVAVSRARYEMKVFSTLTPDQIDLSRTSAEGVAGLKAFLEYAIHGRLALAYEAVTSKSTDDHLVLTVAEKLREKGYEVKTNIGTSGYRVDIGVVDPDNKGEYLIGILCDGYNYSTAKSARDREITRCEVLKQLGWRICRVWAMEWWENSELTMKRLLSAIDVAQNGDWDWREPVVELPTMTEDEDVEFEPEPEMETTHAVPYQQAYLPSSMKMTPEEIVSGYRAYMLRGLFDTVIQAEAPVSRGVLYRRTTAAVGIARTGSRLASYFNALLKSQGYPYTVADGDVFYWNKEQDPISYNVYRIYSDREALDIAPEEVMVAVCEVLEQQGALPEEDLLRQTAKCFNFSRMGDNVMLSMLRGLEKALERDKAVRENGRIKLKK